jgi:hypothetical protein
MTTGLQAPKPIAAKTEVTQTEIPEEDKQVAIVYSPKIDGRTGAFIFVCPQNPEVVSVNDKAFLSQALELDRIILAPGTQLINQQLWEKMKKHPPAAKEITRMEKKGVIRVIYSNLQSNFQTKTTLDFELDDAMDIISASLDVDWLRLCIAKDNRSKVYNACVERVKIVEEMKKGRNLGADA